MGKALAEVVVEAVAKTVVVAVAKGVAEDAVAASAWSP
jgi:hypothetical protein